MWIIFSLQFKFIFEIESLKTNKLTLVLKRDVKISICNVGPLFKKDHGRKGRLLHTLKKPTLVISYICHHVV